MSDRLPYMPWFIDDYLGSTTAQIMDDAGHGQYMLALMACWRDGSVPADEELLRRICKATPESWERWWPVWRDCLEPMGDGSRLYSPPLEAKAASIRHVASKRREAGKAGAAARWHRDGKGNATANGKRNGAANGNANGDPDAIDMRPASQNDTSKPNQVVPNGTTKAARSRPTDADASALASHLADVLANRDGSKRHEPSKSSIDGFRLLIGRLKKKHSEPDPVRRIRAAIDGVFVDPGDDFWASNVRSGKSWNGKTAGGEERLLFIERKLAEARGASQGQRVTRDATQDVLSRLERGELAATVDEKPPTSAVTPRNGAGATPGIRRDPNPSQGLLGGRPHG